jgi:hypothetical protein
VLVKSTAPSRFALRPTETYSCGLIALMMEAVGISEKSVSFYDSTRRNQSSALIYSSEKFTAVKYDNSV